MLNLRIMEASYRCRPWGDRQRNAKTRVYVSPIGETIMDDLMNRRDRPINDWKRMAVVGLDKLGVHYDNLRWSQKAGCSCGCSPGFILDGSYAKDVWITVADAGYQGPERVGGL